MARLPTHDSTKTPGLGHNKPPDIDPNFKPNLAEALRWRAATDPLLSRDATLVIHTLTLVMENDGSCCRPSYNWIARHTKMSKSSIDRVLPEIKAWVDILVKTGTGRTPNTYRPAFSYEDEITAFVERERLRTARLQKSDVVTSQVMQQRTVVTSRLTLQPHSGVNGDATNDREMTPQTVVASEFPVVASNGAVVASSVTHNDSMKDMKAASSETNGDEEPLEVGNLNGSSRQDPDVATVDATYGRNAIPILTDLQQWFDPERTAVLRRLAADTRACGSMNVYSTWSDARTKEHPAAFYSKVLPQRAQERGKAELPDYDSTEFCSPVDACRQMFGKEGF